MATRIFKTLKAFIPRLFGTKPLLPVRQPARPAVNTKRDQARRCSKFPFPNGIAWRTALEPVELMLNELDPVKRKRITEKWVKSLRSHLKVMIITSSIVSTIMASAFSWATFNEDRSNSVCIQIVKAIWYDAILLSVSSIATASQQITSIYRIDFYPQGCEMIHELLGEPVQPPSGSNNGPPRVRLKLSQAFLWQIPKMLLNGSLYLFTVGLCVLTYWDFTKSFDVSVETVQVVGICFFTICVVGAIGPWGIGSMGLYHWIGNMLKVRT